MPEPEVSVQEHIHQELLEGSDLLKRYLNRHAADATDAADFYQEAIARVLEQAQERTIHNPLGYAFRVARNLIINKPKSSYGKPDELELLVCSAPSPEESLSRAQRLLVLGRVLNAMPPLRQKVFVRRRLHGESREQIAKALGISQESVKKHMSRALADLQRHLDKNRC